MAEANEKKGPSKNELKKMAKKAEKAAKKAGGAAAPQKGGAPPKAAAAAAVAPKAARKKPVLELVNAKEGCSESLKVMWASELFGVSVKGGKSALTKEVALMYDDQMVASGSASAQALMYMGGNSTGIGSVMIDPKLDEWCEWERTTLKGAKKPETCFAYLEKTLDSSPRHLVGHSTTLADICVVSTLAQMSNLTPAVQTYVDSHKPAMEAAKEKLAALNAGPPVDMANTSILAVLKQVFSATLKEVFGDDVEIPLAENWIAKCSNLKHGDYQCTAAMPMFAALKKAGALPAGMFKPQDVAKAIVDGFGDGHPMVTDLQVNGPGFVLCRLTPAYLEKHMNKYMETGKLPKPQYESKTCVVDFSSPNIAKEMHVGHLRSTIIGESVCRILEFNGCFVHRVNHVGDWGTQFGMLIQYLKEEYPNFSETMPNITDLTQFYKNAKARFDESPEFKKTAQLNVVKLQSGDVECHKIWNILCDVSRKEFQKVYDRLDITVTECGESFYNDKIAPVIEEFDKSGHISVEEGGAKCVFVDGFNIPLMLQKSDGGYGYDSTDMAALKYRIEELKAQRIIAITDYSQGDHFKMCFSAAEKIGWLADGKTQLAHIGFGTVMGEDGKRFKTRSGDTVRLVDLLDEAVGRMKASLNERIAEKKTGISPEDVPKVAEAIGYSAVKYFDLRRNPTTNYKFSYDGMLDTKGNTAVYLLYAYARLESIVTKAKKDFNADVDELIKNKKQIVLGHPSERGLALQLQGFTDMMEATLEDLFPYHVCDYVYNLSIAASDFVTQCKVLGSPEMESRLLMCKATAMAMRECFELVGIQPVQRI